MSTIGARGQAVIETVPARDGHHAVKYRHAGDRFLLVEYGEMTLDLTINFRILGFNEELKRQGLRGLIETVPALRSILIHYDSTKLSTSDLIAALKRLEEKVPTAEHLTIPSRIVTLPIAFADHWTRANVEQYVKYVRKDAPNVVDGYNIDYNTQYNGLRNREEVITYIMGTDWWNACLGFWPGLPFMFPLDPRYAIVTPKYNPTRPWTTEGAVGIGGPCVAIYPVDSPGGYQLFGRTIPIYDPKQRSSAFKENPILLRPADRVRFTRVTDEELDAIRQRVVEDRYRYQIEDGVLNVREYIDFVKSVKSEVEAFRKRQEEALKHVMIP